MHIQLLTIQNDGNSVNKNALENAKIHRLEKNARAGLQQPAAAQEDLARVSDECAK